ncbi:MAG TPA: histidine phosphatase family protein [Candidatus Dormibacteraeota bacterium]|jgi:probable phosphoglycerate mutase|nr:histidine phosphatase family protein [Candidatus Dormibacteraeota bacterium]
MVTAQIPLHLVRHGESGWNAERRVQGHAAAAPSLTPLGRAQARDAADLLADRAPHARLVVSSDLPRARETALIVALALGLPLRWDAELREQNLGELEGRLRDEPHGAGTVGSTVDELWRSPRLRPAGGESIAELHLRVHRALARLAASAPPAGLIVVTHGGVVRVATMAAPVAAERRPVGNASVTTVAVAAAPAAWMSRRAS